MLESSKLEDLSFHLVDPNPWPLVVSSSVLLLLTGSVSYMHNYGGMEVMGVGFMLLLLSVFLWLKDVVSEGTYEGQHVGMVQEGFKLGFLLFIMSEVMFFGGFFWGYFWLSLGGEQSMGGTWPGEGVEVMKSSEMPLCNTLMLLGSGCTITWAHHGLMEGNSSWALSGMFYTLMLALMFTSLQVYEYSSGDLSMSDGSYGSSFYMLTGFHGFHVMMGSIMMLVTGWSMYSYEQTQDHHMGFEVSAYYWHFVDVVWLYLYLVIYLLVDKG